MLGGQGLAQEWRQHYASGHRPAARRVR